MEDVRVWSGRWGSGWRLEPAGTKKTAAIAPPMTTTHPSFRPILRGWRRGGGMLRVGVVSKSAYAGPVANVSAGTSMGRVIGLLGGTGVVAG